MRVVLHFLVLLFYEQIKGNTSLKLTKKQRKAKRSLEAGNSCYLKIVCFIRGPHHPKIRVQIKKPVPEIQCICFKRIISIIIIKMKTKMRNIIT